MFRDDLLEELAKTPLEIVPIKSIIDKYCDVIIEFPKEDKQKYESERLKIISVLRELQKRDFIELIPERGLSAQSEFNPNTGNLKFSEGTDIRAMLTTVGEKEVNRNKDQILTRQLADSTKKANKTSIRYAWISGFFIGLGLLFQILTYIQQKEPIDIQREQADIEYKSLHKTLHDSLCPLLNPRHKQGNKNGNKVYLSKTDTTSKTK